MLAEHGYNTYCVGKWHLTPGEECNLAAFKGRWPLGRGFERFYGWLGGETNSWYPDLVHDNHPIEAPGRPEDGYHLADDLADKAVEFIRDAKVIAPDKPFFMYLAPQAGHAPHLVPQEWADRYRGVFDEGYEAIRAGILERQIALGLLPENTELSPINPHGEPGAFVLIDKRGAALPVSSQKFSMPLGNGLLPVRIDDKVGFARPTGELVIPASYLLTLGFSEGLAAVKTPEGWGYIDVHGVMVIAPQFASASNFADGLAHVHRGGHGGFIDRAGHFFADPPHASQVGRFAGGFAPYRALSRIGVPAWGYVDRHGAVALPPTHDFAGEFSEGLAAAQQDDLFGYLGPNMDFVIPPQFTIAGEFHGGLAPVAVDALTGYCDRKGTLVIEPKYARGGAFAEELAPVVVGNRTGFIDPRGRMVIDPTFDTALPFSEGLAAVRVSHR